MNKLRVGIVGAGYIGGLHAAVLARDDRVRVAAVHDAVRERAERLAGSTRSDIANSVAGLIEAVDAVFITTPNTKHTAITQAAIEAGKHVFCEKPVATSVEEARIVLNAASGSQSVFQVGHNRRFAPVYSTLKQMLSESGPPHSAHVKMNRGELINPEWVGDPQVTGGFLYETPIHMFDMMRFLFGEVASLDAVGSSHEYPETDDFSVLLRFESGMHASLASSADATWLFPFERVEVFCHHRTVVTREMESISGSEAKKLGSEYLQEEMRTRLSRGPARFDFQVQIAKPQDKTADPRAHWPSDRERAVVGTLELTGIDESTETDGAIVVFDPMRLTDGIEASDDPILHYRPGAYDVSATRRSS